MHKCGCRIFCEVWQDVTNIPQMNITSPADMIYMKHHAQLVIRDCSNVLGFFRGSYGGISKLNSLCAWDVLD